MEKRTAPIAKGIVISIISGVLSAALGAYSVTALLVAPAFLSCAFSAWGYGVGAVGLISYAATAYLVGGASASVYMMACVLPASFAIGFAIMKKKLYHYFIKKWKEYVSKILKMFGQNIITFSVSKRSAEKFPKTYKKRRMFLLTFIYIYKLFVKFAISLKILS